MEDEHGRGGAARERRIRPGTPSPASSAEITLLATPAGDNQIVLQADARRQRRFRHRLVRPAERRRSHRLGHPVGQLLRRRRISSPARTGRGRRSPPSGRPTLQNGVYGTLSVDADGEWNYALANSATNVQALAQGEHATDTFTVTVSDEHGGIRHADGHGRRRRQQRRAGHRQRRSRRSPEATSSRTACSRPRAAWPSPPTSTTARTLHWSVTRNAVPGRQHCLPARLPLPARPADHHRNGARVLQRRLQRRHRAARAAGPARQRAFRYLPSGGFSESRRPPASSTAQLATAQRGIGIDT